MRTILTRELLKYLQYLSIREFQVEFERHTKRVSLLRAADYLCKIQPVFYIRSCIRSPLLSVAIST